MDGTPPDDAPPPRCTQRIAFGGSKTTQQVVPECRRDVRTGGREPWEPSGNERQRHERRAEQPDDETHDQVLSFAGRRRAAAQLVREGDGAEQHHATAGVGEQLLAAAAAHRGAATVHGGMRRETSEVAGERCCGYRRLPLYLREAGSPCAGDGECWRVRRAFITIGPSSVQSFILDICFFAPPNHHLIRFAVLFL